MSNILPIAKSTTVGPLNAGRIAYGCWRMAGATASEAQSKIEAALAVGINMIDTAPIYGFGKQGFGPAEAVLGEGMALGGLRDRVLMVTKGGIHPPNPYDSRAQTLIESCDDSLKRLRTDHIDLFLIHRPDLLAAHEEVAEALTTLRTAGKIREAGVSNFSTDQLRALQSKLDFPLSASQPEFSAIHTDPLTNGDTDIAQELGLCLMAWSPLGGGRLVPGARGEPGSAEARVLAVLEEIAGRNDVGIDHVALAWVLAHPGVGSALIGTQSEARIRESVKAFEVQMTRRDWYAVLEAARGEKMP
ncbi:aldo/keto reductase [Shimia abyssi]|uniref:Putative oxidoreductase n=1 Tax=Shimia abyssi TaxID=1662395 RepID=A0A2P8FK35_9RHOB|nr:aldo/keto reductase [Shimia abyssi]PSL22072.1 putative oxidoreductase [Shimia abyssi]